MTRDDALAFSTTTYRALSLEIYQVGECGQRVPRPELQMAVPIGWIPPDCWFIMFSSGFHGEIGPSRLVCTCEI
jgi:hypothetical protein